MLQLGIKHHRPFSAIKLAEQGTRERMDYIKGKGAMLEVDSFVADTSFYFSPFAHNSRARWLSSSKERAKQASEDHKRGAKISERDLAWKVKS